MFHFVKEKWYNFEKVSLQLIISTDDIKIEYLFLLINLTDKNRLYLNFSNNL